MTNDVQVHRRNMMPVRHFQKHMSFGYVFYKARHQLQNWNVAEILSAARRLFAATRLCCLKLSVR